MLVDVTQNLAVRVTPVNNPSKTNKYDEQQGYYLAFVTHHTDEVTAHDFAVAESEWMRGIVPSNVGYGSHSTARIAVINALDDYTDKFGPVCVVNTDNAA